MVSDQGPGWPAAEAAAGDGAATPHNPTHHIKLFLRSLLWAWLVLGLPALVLVAREQWTVGAPFSRVAGYTAIWLVGLGALSARRLDPGARARAVVVALFGVSVLAFIQAALEPAGVIFCWAAVLVASIAFGRRGLLLGLLVSGAIFTLAAAGFTTATLPTPALVWTDPRRWHNWLRVGAGALLPLAAVAAGIIAMLTSLQEAASEADRTFGRAQDSERRFRSVMEQSTDAVYCYEYDPSIATDLPVETQVEKLNDDAVIIECNEVASRLLGLDGPAAVIGKRLTDVPRGDPERRRRQFRAFVQNGYRLSDYEFDEGYASDSRRRLSADVRSVMEDGRLVRVWITVSDVTEAREAQEALRASESRYRTLFESSGDGVLILKDGIFVECNPAALRMFDYPESTLLGRRPVDVSPERQRDGQLSSESARDRITAALSGIPQRFPWRHSRRDGTELDVEVSLTSLTLDGAPCLLAIVRDVSARVRAEEALRESEERYRQLFEAAGDAVFVHALGQGGLPGRFLEVNDVACRILGYTRDELLAMKTRDVNAPGQTTDLDAVFARYAAGQPATFERVHLTRDGRRIPVEIHATPFIFKGQPAVMALVRDITERKDAERELRQLSLRLETIRTEESRRLARRVHDDVGQQLTALQIDLVRLRGQIGASRDIQARIEAAARLVGETLETVRGISHDLHPRILDDLGLGAAVSAHARRLSQRSDLACVVDVWPEDIALDRQRSEALYRVYREAMTNVLRHAGATRVDIRLHQTPEAIELSVEDDGRGLAPQADATSQSLGLLYMRESMRALGGTCTITSAPGGQGTTVKARMPASEARAAAPSPPV